MTKDEALDLALEALKQIYTAMPFPAGSKAITAIKQARSAPAQEPVAFNAGVPPLYPEMKDGETISVEYTTPPAAQRQSARSAWVGLSEEEILKLAYPIRWQEVDDFESDKTVNFAQMVEAKLKEKNT